VFLPGLESHRLLAAIEPMGDLPHGDLSGKITQGFQLRLGPTHFVAPHDLHLCIEAAIYLNQEGKSMGKSDGWFVKYSRIDLSRLSGILFSGPVACRPPISGMGFRIE